MVPLTFASSPAVSSRDLRIDIPDHLTYGSLPTNRGLRVSIHLPEQKGRNEHALAAVIESPAFARQVSPLVFDIDTKEFSTIVDLGPISVSLGDPPKAAAIHVSVARRQGSHLEELARRTVIITVAVPGYSERSSRQINPDAMALDTATTSPRATGSDGIGLNAAVQELDLMRGLPVHPTDGYWKLLNTLIYRRMAARPVCGCRWFIFVCI